MELPILMLLLSQYGFNHIVGVYYNYYTWSFLFSNDNVGKKHTIFIEREFINDNQLVFNLTVEINGEKICEEYELTLINFEHKFHNIINMFKKKEFDS